ncbi:MAG: DUF3179 domain-containing protein [Chloroflexi bacterium]|nr:MAG: DUF3179 domain-containing protein [Chloroflexota bacterium]
MMKNRRWFFGLIGILLLAACARVGITPVSQTAVHTPTPEQANAASPCPNPLTERQFPLPPWPRTNFCRHTVPYEEIRFGGVQRDSIPAIDTPIFDTVAQGSQWLADVEPVLAFVWQDDARAYPLQILVWHEIVNDVVGGRPVVVTYCPLCDSGLVFDRTINGQVLDFGTTGNLRNADLIMYDRQTESWWQQFTGTAIVGEMTGQQLTLLPAGIVSWGEFRAQFPNGRILLGDASGTEREYGKTPYINYDALSNPRTSFFDGETDGRLPPKMRVMGVEIDNVAIAYPYSLLSEQQVVNDTIANQPLVIFWKSGTVSPLYREVIAESRDVGSAAVFSRELDGQILTFVPGETYFQDAETGSEWNLWGTAVSGPLAGSQLTRLRGHEFLWFAWAAFHPDTLIYTSN